MKKTILTLILSTIIIGVFAQKAYTLEGSEVKIEKPVLFKTGTAILLPEADEALNIIKQYLDDKTYISMLRVEGHTDNSGNSEATQKLSEQRALAVCIRLREWGVDCKRLIAVGFGSNKPVADNSMPEGKAENRRISFVNVSIKGKLIGGLPEDGGGTVAGDPCN
ncbi:MAG: OmpA family protein [Ferruginibacter sp.]